MKLITELVEDVTISMIEEAAIGGGTEKRLYISGPFMMYGTANRNKRIYPREILVKETTNYVENYVSKNRAFGELGHPTGPTINLDRTCILIKELKDSGDGNIMGRALVTSTPMGKIVEGLIKDGAIVGVSSRALGSLRRQGDYDVVQEDLRLATAADVVADPSAHTAFVQGIMESKEWVLENGVWKDIEVAEAKKIINENSIPTRTKEDRTASFAKLFEGYLASVGRKIG